MSDSNQSEMEAIQKRATAIMNIWTEKCEPAGDEIAKALASLSGTVELPPDVADDIVALCEQNLKIGAFLALYSFKVGFMESDEKGVRTLLDSYNQIYNEVSKEYLKELRTLAKVLKTEHGLNDLSDEVAGLYRALKRVMKSIEPIQSTLKKCTEPRK